MVTSGDSDSATDVAIAVHAVHIDNLLKNQADMQSTLKEIQSTLQEAKGGWKTLMWLGGAGGVVGAAVAQMFSNFHLPK